MLPKGFWVGALFKISKFGSEPISVFGCRPRSPTDEQQFLCKADRVRRLPKGFLAGALLNFSSPARNRFLCQSRWGINASMGVLGRSPFLIYRFCSKPMSVIGRWSWGPIDQQHPLPKPIGFEMLPKGFLVGALFLRIGSVRNRCLFWDDGLGARSISNKTFQSRSGFNASRKCSWPGLVSP